MAAAQTMAMTATQKIIAIAVTIIIISTVALPVIEDMQKEYYIIEQNTGYNYSYSSGLKDIELSFIQNDDTTFNYSIDGNAIYSNIDDSSHEVAVYTDRGVAYLLPTVFVALFEDTDGTTIYFADASSIVMTVSNSVLTIAYGDGDTTTTKEVGEISWMYYPNSEGSYGVFAGSDYIHIDNDSKALIVAHPVIAGGVFTPYYVGEFSNGSITVLAASAWSDNVFHDVTPNVIVDRDTDYNDPLNTMWGDVTGTCVLPNSTTYDFTNLITWIAPIDYKAVDSNSEAGLFSVVAIILVLVPVMMAVRMITLRRN